MRQLQRSRHSGNVSKTLLRLPRLLRALRVLQLVLELLAMRRHVQQGRRRVCGAQCLRWSIVSVRRGKPRPRLRWWRVRQRRALPLWLQKQN